MTQNIQLDTATRGKENRGLRPKASPPARQLISLGLFRKSVYSNFI